MKPTFMDNLIALVYVFILAAIGWGILRFVTDDFGKRFGNCPTCNGTGKLKVGGGGQSQ